MKEKNVNFFKRFNVLPKIFCILVAFLIWLYVTAVESPDHEETISSVPVELFGAGTILSDHNLSPVSGRDIKIDIVVKGQPVWPEKSHGQGSLVCYSPWGHKSWTLLSARAHTCTRMQ